MQLQMLDVTVRDYINELQTSYEQQIHKLHNDVIEYQNKYLEIKERYDLLIYKRFMRSAEQLAIDENQPLLFASEGDETGPTQEAQEQEETEVKSHTRKKPGRKPLDPNLPRVAGQKHLLSKQDRKKELRVNRGFKTLASG